MDEDVDYANIFKSLSTGAKKGFFKKQNRSGSGDDFAFAAKALATQDCPDLAAVFLLGKAKCESASNRFTTEASTLITAARNFLRAEDQLDRINSISFSENLDCATQCILKAAKIYENCDLLPLAVNAYIYLSDTLMRHQRWSEALPYLKHSLECLPNDQPYHISILRKILTCQLNIRDWPGSLTTCIQVQLLLDCQRTNDFALSDEHSHCWSTVEALRVCLLLLTVPPRKLADMSDSSYALVAYSVDATEPPEDMQEELFLHLQSLVIAYRYGDTIEVERAVTSLQSFFDPNHRHLLSLLSHSCIDVCA